MPKITYVLYGTSERDGLVCQFFDSHDELVEFVYDLPGDYDMLKLRGVVPADFNVFGHMDVMRVGAGWKATLI